MNPPITARYAGICTRSGQAFDAGEQIARDQFGYYLAGTPDPGGDIHLEGGSGNGCEGWTIGQAYWNATNVVVVTRAGSVYHRSDGWSFGAFEDSGYAYWAHARPATPEEAAPLIQAAETRKAELDRERALAAGLRALFDWRTGQPNTPEGRDLHVQGRHLKIGRGFTLYGGGEELVIDTDGQHVWKLVNNGGDGDNWAHNNVGGMIGTRFPLTDERRAFLADHWPDTAADDEHW